MTPEHAKAIEDRAEALLCHPAPFGLVFRDLCADTLAVAAAWRQERERADRAERDYRIESGRIDALAARLEKGREGLKRFLTAPTDAESEEGWAALRSALEAE